MHRSLILYPFQLLYTVIAAPLCLLSVLCFPILFLPVAGVRLIGRWATGTSAKERLDRADKRLMTFLSNLQARLIIFFLAPRLTVKGKENIPHPEEKVCFVANHQGVIDPILFEMCVPQKVAYISKIELVKVPYVHLWLKTMHCVTLNRKNPREGIQSILKGVEYIRQGHPQMIFPEGTRNYGKGIREFKGGSFKLATKAEALIVPVTLDGTYRLLDQKPFAIRPFEKVTVTIHPPIPTQGLSREAETQLHRQVWEIINQGLEHPFTEVLPPKHF